MRTDGRTPESLRPVRITRNYLKHAEGSVLVEFGDTKVICTASVEESVPPFLRGKGEGWVTAEYGMLPRATHTRSDREAARGKQGGRTLEIQRLVGRALRACVDRGALGERTITLDCDVLQADGGTRTAAITGAYVALALRNHSNLFVVTNSVFVAQTLAMRNNNRVFLAGGELRAHDGGAFGAEALDLLRRLNVQLAVFSVGAVNSELGFMLHDLEEANIARVAAENAQVCIVVADSGKFNKRAPVSLDKMSSIDVFFTDSPPPDGIREMLDKNEIETVVVEGKERHAGWSKLLAKNKASPTP